MKPIYLSMTAFGPFTSTAEIDFCRPRHKNRSYLQIQQRQQGVLCHTLPGIQESVKKRFRAYEGKRLSGIIYA